MKKEIFNVNYNMFCLLATESGAQASNLATIISGVINAVAVIIVYLLTKNFQKKQDEKSQEFQEMQAKEAKDFQKKQDEESQKFQERTAKESHKFQKELAEESRKFQEKLNDDNFERRIKEERPYIVVESPELIFQYDSTYTKDLLNVKWVYEDDIQKQLLGTDYEYNIRVYLRFRNIGKSMAKKIEVVNTYINADEKLKKFDESHKLPHELKRGEMNGNTTVYRLYEEDKDSPKVVSFNNEDEMPHHYKFDLLKSNDFIKVSINESDLKLINYFLFYTYALIHLPKLKFSITYFDQYDNFYKDNFNIILRPINTAINPGKLSDDYKNDKSILITAEIENT
nr:MAG TPA: hypothetical protein [Caudoviricetes sp.]